MLLILRFSQKKIYLHAVFIIFLFLWLCINLFLNPQKQNIFFFSFQSVCLNFRAEIEEQERFAISPSLFSPKGLALILQEPSSIYSTKKKKENGWMGSLQNQIFHQSNQSLIDILLQV